MGETMAPAPFSGINDQYPSGDGQMEEMMQPGPDGPIYMVNLLKFKDKAEYEDGRKTNLTGREAYNLYGQAVQKILPTYKGTPHFMADVNWLALGQIDNLWDEVAIVSYAARSDLLAMSLSPEWQEASVHRTAGLAGQLNIECLAPAGLKSAIPSEN